MYNSNDVLENLHLVQYKTLVSLLGNGKQLVKRHSAGMAGRWWSMRLFYEQVDLGVNYMGDDWLHAEK